MMMNNQQRMNFFLNYLQQLFPDAHCELNYRFDYELLIAVMLSAQATDKSVNKATEKLFNRYPTLLELSQARVDEVEQIIKFLGMFKQKSQRVVDIAKKLVTEFDGKVPKEKDTLTTFPGVGNKTANVVRAEFFKLNELPVDTHVERVAKRLRFANVNDSTLIVEQKLKKLVSSSIQIKTHHQMIFFGRYFCKSINPNCSMCLMCKECRYFKNKVHQ